MWFINSILTMLFSKAWLSENDKNFRKRQILVLAICTSIFNPCLSFSRAYWYQGNIPPKVPLIETTGTLIFKHGATRNGSSTTVFSTDDGKMYRFQADISYDFAAFDPQRRPLGGLTVRGFILRNGKGLFWPIEIENSEGEILLNRKVQETRLSRNKNIFNDVLFWSFAFMSPLWGLSIYYASKITRSRSWRA